MPSFFSSLYQRYWWVILVIALAFFVRFLAWFGVRKWKRYVRTIYRQSIPFTVLDITVPDQLEKTPAAMEQLFSVLHGVYSTFNFRQQWLQGMVNDWFSFEIVSYGGDIHFYIRTPTYHQNLIESQVYAQFPEAEIRAVTDWVEKLPFVNNEPVADYDFWIEELILTKPDCYPILTYIDFELKQGLKAEFAVDPAANLLEMMGHIDPEEVMVFQIVITPEGNEWQAEGRKIVDEKMGKTEENNSGLNKAAGNAAKWAGEFGSQVGFLLGGEPPSTATRQDQKGERNFLRGVWLLSPGEQDMIKAIDRNISKVGFFTTARYAYYAPRELFKKRGSDRAQQLGSVFEQYTSTTLNSLTINSKLTGWVKWFPRDIYNTRNIYFLMKYRRPLPINFENVRFLHKKELMRALKERKFGKTERGHQGFIFTPEELATIFHFPMKSVATPELPRVTAKKGGAPPGLPVA